MLLDRLVVELHDDVPGLEPSLVRGGAGQHLGHQRPSRLVHAQGFGQERRHLLEGHAQPASGDAAVVPELRQQLLDEVDGDGEPDADVASASTVDGGVHPHDLAAMVDERAAGIARVDGCVGLDEVVVGAGADTASFGADDPGSDRAVQSERVADGQHSFADLQPVRVSQGRGGQRIARVDPHQRDVGLLVRADDLPLELVLVGEGDGDDAVLMARHHVVVGQDQALGIDDHPRPERLGPAAGRGGRARGSKGTRHAEVLEELPPRIGQGMAEPLGPLGRFGFALGGDVDHRGADRLDQLHDVVDRPLLRGRGFRGRVEAPLAETRRQDDQGQQQGAGPQGFHGFTTRWMAKHGATSW